MNNLITSVCQLFLPYCGRVGTCLLLQTNTKSCGSEFYGSFFHADFLVPEYPNIDPWKSLKSPSYFVMTVLWFLELAWAIVKPFSPTNSRVRWGAAMAQLFRRRTDLYPANLGSTLAGTGDIHIRPKLLPCASKSATYQYLARHVRALEQRSPVQAPGL